jgi:flagellar biosynthesis anti-sigma factor FlgM
MESSANLPLSFLEVAMSIQGIGNNSPVQKVTANPIQKSLPADASQPTRGSDKVELSSVSNMLQTLKSGGDVRVDKVASIRAQIESGNYADNDQKLDVAADRMLDDLMK